MIHNISKDDTTLDSDGDSLNDLQEMIQGTDPYIADSDGDGILTTVLERKSSQIWFT